MCGCSVNLAGRSASALRSSELPFNNTAEDIIAFIVDNNESGVRANMSADGISNLTLSKADIKRWLVNSYNLGYEVAPYIIVRYNNDANDYTGGLLDKYPEANKLGADAKGEIWTDYVIPFVFGGLGALGGTAVLNQTGLNQPPPPPQPATIPVWVWIVAGVLVLVLVVVIARR